MNIDYMYCLNQDTCIHRRGCRRWIGNYSNEDAIEESNNNRIGYINNEHCMFEDYDNDNTKLAFDMLDRFRLSDGTEIKK